MDFSTHKKIKIFKDKLNKKEIKVFIKELEKITNRSFKILQKSIEKYKKIRILLNRIKTTKIVQLIKFTTTLISAKIMELFHLQILLDVHSYQQIF